MKKEVTDKELVKKFKKGDIASFEELVRRHESKVYNLAMRYTKNTEDAEEVLQDVFTTIFRKIKSFEGKSAFTSWMYRITVNAAFMKLRKNKQNKSIPFEDLSILIKEDYIDQCSAFANKSDTFSITRELREELNLAIAKLPEEYKSVFVLRDVQGLSNEETSEVLSITVPAVKSRLHRARMMLRKKLQLFWNDFNGSEKLMKVTKHTLKAANLA